MSDSLATVRAVLESLVKGHCRKDCGEKGRPYCRAHEALAALGCVVREERQACAEVALDHLPLPHLVSPEAKRTHARVHRIAAAIRGRQP